MQATARVPDPSTFTSAPLRHRLRIDLTAPIAEVWALVGRHERLPEYSGGIAAVEVEDRPRARVCRFRSPDEKSPGPMLREHVRWEVENVGHATSAEPGNAFGLSNSLSLVTVEPSPTGTLFTWEERYDSADLPASRASFDEGLADIAKRLVARFGGRVLERYVDSGR